MATKQRIFDLWSPPAVTKEDAAEPEYSGWVRDKAFNSGHPHDDLYPDGYDAGSELPSDISIDRMVYPHAESEREEETRELKYGRDQKIQEFKDAQFERNRQFRITDQMAVGQGGPPSMFDDHMDTAEEKREQAALKNTKES